MTLALQGCRVMSGRLCDAGSEDGHVISWQRRDVNLPPDPILKLMAVASCRSLYIISSATQRSRREAHRLLQRKPTSDQLCCQEIKVSGQWPQNGLG
ncbi:hypothetical protein CUJ84_Chr002097 [Rhizobium leguminosarum]|uniref:Uncharacterized protein n=1 Tax=Rhizobium leguminosarum TaxID=384 RepID=A0A2K9Z2J5_RHILE|nr:hypothetical protein CUJ84_Chr002097 [Rhizobium leguminosarum]